jgi:mannose-6-phosphate isomerase-like protein (cupin superfamily)
MPLEYIIPIALIGLLSYLLGLRSRKDVVYLNQSKRVEYQNLAALLEEENGGGHIISVLPDGNEQLFPVKMHEWVYLAEKTRIKGTIKKVDYFQVVVDHYYDSPGILHSHSISEGLQVIKGKIKVTIGEKQTVHEAGSTIFFPANVPHKVDPEKDETTGEYYAKYMAYWPG